MAGKKNVNIKIGADVKEAQSGIQKVTNELNKLSKNKALTSLSRLGSAVSGVNAAFGMVSKTLSTAKAAVDDVTNAYNVQAQAEKQLEAAAKNNPYLSDYSVDQLKKYAGELQAISSVGDEELLPMMAQLAAAGRTQNEIQDIMSAALDVSASGAMSLDTAVKQLNATYAGTTGQLGKTNAAIRNLSKEELQNGEAVRIMKEQYSGIAKTVSDSTGGWQKFKNSFGDFKEILGSGFANIQNSTGKVLSGFFDTITSKIKTAGEEADKFKKKLGIIATLDDENSTLADLEGVVNQLQKTKERLDNMSLVAEGKTEDVTKNLTSQAKAEIAEYNKELEDFESKIESAKDKVNALETKGIELNRAFYSSSDSAEQKRLQNVYEQTKAEQIAAEEEVGILSEKRRQYEKTSQARIDSARKTISAANDEVNSIKNSFNDEFYGSRIALANEQKKVEKQLAEAIKKRDAAQKEADKSKVKGEAASRDEKALEIISKNNAELQKNIAAIEQKYSLMEKEGQKIDEVAKSQEILSAQENAYLRLISEDTNLVTQNNAVAKARLADIKKSYEQVTEAIKKKAEAENDKKALEELKLETEKLTEEAKKFLGVFSEPKLSEQISASIKKLEEMKDTVAQGSEEWEYYCTKILKLSDLLDEVKVKEAEIAEQNKEQSDVQKWASLHEEKLKVVSDYASKYLEIMQGISNMVKIQAENEAKVKTAALDKQLSEGIISEEEYAKEKEEIEKEAAKKSYEIQMWEWSASLLTIGLQTAQGIMNALATSGNIYAGIALAATVGVLGAVQLATAIANKPVPPSFATGGVVGGFQGASMGGDNTYAHVRNGEMILNAAQQKAIWNQLNGLSGKTGSGLTNNVTIKNYAAGNVSVSQVSKNNGFDLIIRETVRKQLAAGEYSSQLEAAQAQLGGIRFV